MLCSVVFGVYNLFTILLTNITMEDKAKSNQIPTLTVHGSNLFQLCCIVYCKFCKPLSVTIGRQQVMAVA